ncbi:DUF4178 domain-containing protein [Mycobacterium sp. CBMA293]|uniref:DUF4178 domain-containing protein n=1 Tax=unclassified Mycolicibacterium TaxID=2636767 RepID=UPI00132A0D63|nr:MULTISPECIES: DUF4178 domain-containing protein [unclassified Mycolicibacterium]MUL49342.1 DUF4178 domain-containing protein [Mycolicibacterium sp. CBMA 360]MUL96748.1 DUF4178 domain-containing protein [Mycolicibacterium sp. CBMA 230]MUM33957.1 DUF4178 domain-containing protein [Mycolicibacterium sp. CBMA 361]MUL57753.1 DUF4178 domain-containing protein [Mycolicibacterium sp. CBMA 335]MUL72798.1 DUF4178 domain-containing protein [Mycolicibacterium sp. CBMA 311]
MSTFLIVLGVILAIAAVVVVVLAFVRGRKPEKPSARQDPLKSGDMPVFGPKQLGPGAIVSYGGVDYVVRGSVTYHEGPFAWWEHLLEGGQGEPIWFSVEEDEGRLELAFWAKRSDLALQPGGPHTVDGVQYSEVERGTARYTCEGTTGLPVQGEMYYVDYASAGRSALLSFEQWAPNTPWEVSTGKIMSPGELTVYPAPPAGS